MATPATDTLEPQPVRASIAEPTFASDERGQISIMVVLCLIPFILLLAFIFNSGKQTSRKIAMQGAADAAAVASAVTTARGMNFMVLNNNAMAEVLSVMIAVRSIRNTTRIMQYYVPLKTTAVCVACLGVCSLCHSLARSIPKWFSAASMWSSIDARINNESSGFGWELLRLLDGLNQIVRSGFPFWSAYQARDFAQKNGADFDPIYGFVLGGKSDTSLNLGGLSLPLPIPTFPVARGPEQAIAFRVEACQYQLRSPLNLFASAYLLTIDIYSAPEAVALYLALRWANISHLKGDWGTLGSILNEIFNRIPRAIGRFLGRLSRILGRFLGIELLSWTSNPPKPMLLTDHPADDTTDEREIDEETRTNLQPYLQHLGLALGRVPIGSPIGGNVFLNKPNAWVQMQFTYAEADIYNPTKWDMWTQDWRAQLSRSKMFDRKVNDILQILPSLQGGLDWSFVNTH